MCDKPDRFQWWESFVYTDRFQWQQSFVYKKRGVDVVYSKLARPSRPPIVSLYPKKWWNNMHRKLAGKQALGGWWVRNQLIFLMGQYWIQYCLTSLLTTWTVRWSVLLACLRMKANSSKRSIYWRAGLLVRQT